MPIYSQRSPKTVRVYAREASKTKFQLIKCATCTRRRIIYSAASSVNSNGLLIREYSISSLGLDVVIINCCYTVATHRIELYIFECVFAQFGFRRIDKLIRHLSRGSVCNCSRLKKFEVLIELCGQQWFSLLLRSKRNDEVVLYNKLMIARSKKKSFLFTWSL